MTAMGAKTERCVLHQQGWPMLNRHRSSPIRLYLSAFELRATEKVSMIFMSQAKSALVAQPRTTALRLSVHTDCVLK